MGARIAPKASTTGGDVEVIFTWSWRRFYYADENSFKSVSIPSTAPRSLRVRPRTSRHAEVDGNTGRTERAIFTRLQYGHNARVSTCCWEIVPRDESVEEFSGKGYHAFSSSVARRTSEGPVKLLSTSESILGSTKH